MTMRFALAPLTALALCAAPSLAARPVKAPRPAPAAKAVPLVKVAPVAPAPKDGLVTVALDTEAGRIVLALDQARAPATVANFLAYVDKGWLNGEPFYRAMPWGKGGLIQGGVRNGAHQLPPVKHEPTSVTGLKNVAGTIAMANVGAGTARSDFFIMTTDIAAFDSTADQPGFAAFGHVVEGMDVVNRILAAPVDPNKGDGPMKGQMLSPTIKILTAKRVKASPAG